jgi:uncharacterized protein (TIGR02217 family)
MADVNVYDDIGLTDSVTASVPILRIYPYDAIAVTDSVRFHQKYSASVFDSVALVDGIGRLATSAHLVILLNDYVGVAAYSGFGQQFPVEKSYEWRTDLVKYDSGREQRNLIYSQPIRRWKINWQVMDEAARNRLIEVFHRSRGMFRTFQWKDWDDYKATNAEIATDGVTTEYQLVKTYFFGEGEYWSEEKHDIAPTSVFAPIVWHSVDGLQTRTTSNPPAGANQYYLDDRDGTLIWSTAPSVGTLTCTFEFYYRVRFDFDEYVDLMFTADYWRAEGVNLIEVLT